MHLRTRSRAQRGLALATGLGLAILVGTSCSTGTGFSWTVTPTARTVQPGGAATFTVRIASKESIASPVRLSVSGLPAGATARGLPRTLASTASTAEIAIDVSGELGLGAYPFQLTAEELGFAAHSSNLRLDVTSGGTEPDFTLEVDPAEYTWTGSSSITFTYFARPLNEFAGLVSISLGKLPAGLTLVQDVTPTAVGLNMDGHAGAGGTFVVRGPAVARQATEEGELVVTATSGALRHSRTIVLHWPADTSPDFELELEPADIRFSAPNTVHSVTITARPRNGFSGAVALDLGAPPAGFEAFNLSHTTLTIGPTSSASATFDLYWHGTAGPATVSLAVSGTSGDTTHSLDLAIRRPVG